MECTERRSNLRDDLSILKDMYPELEVDSKVKDIDDDKLKVISGKLPFKLTLPIDLVVNFEGKSLVFSSLSTDILCFGINKLYPNLKDGIELSIKSEWMTKEDIELIIDNLHNEFDAMTDPSSDFYDPCTPILMLLFSCITNESTSIIFPNNTRECRTAEEFRIFERIKGIIHKEEISKKNFTCSICMDTKKGDKMIELPCRETPTHYLCEPCIIAYYSKMIIEGNMEYMRCPECKYEETKLDEFKDYKVMKDALFTPAIPFDFFEGILSSELCQRYRDLFHSYCATKLSKYSTSATILCRRCDVWCVKENLDDPMMTCDNCSLVFCFNCLHSWHGYNNKCGKKVKIPREIVEEYMNEDGELLVDRKKELEVKYGKKLLDAEVSDYLADKLLDIAIAEKDSNLQRCPNCRLVIQRSEGCNKMKCGVCGCLFCFICGSSLYPDDPYEHFREAWSDCYGRLFEGMVGVDI